MANYGVFDLAIRTRESGSKKIPYTASNLFTGN